MKTCPKCHKSWPDYFSSCDCGYIFPVKIIQATKERPQWRKHISGNVFMCHCGWEHPGVRGCVVPLGLLLAWSGLLFYNYQQIEPCPPCIEDCFCDLERPLFLLCSGGFAFIWVFVAGVWWLKSDDAFFPKRADGSTTNWPVLILLSVMIVGVTFMLLPW